MDIPLNVDSNNFVKEQMATGLYSSISELFQEALDLLKLKKSVSQTSIDMFNAEIAKGEADIQAGRYSDADKFFKGLIAKYE